MESYLGKTFSKNNTDFKLFGDIITILKWIFWRVSLAGACSRTGCIEPARTITLSSDGMPAKGLVESCMVPRKTVYLSIFVRKKKLAATNRNSRLWKKILDCYPFNKIPGERDDWRWWPQPSRSHWGSRPFLCWEPNTGPPWLCAPKLTEPWTSRLGTEEEESCLYLLQGSSWKQINVSSQAAPPPPKRCPSYRVVWLACHFVKGSCWFRLVELDLLELGVWVWWFVFPGTQLLITEHSQGSVKTRGGKYD